MADLYTLTMRRQHIVSIFDAKGNKSGETTTWLEEKHHDLPAMTVANYRKAFPDNVVSAVLQDRADTLNPRRSSARTHFDDRRADAAPNRQKRPLAASKASEAPIYGDDYAAAVNAAVKREARA